MAADDYEYFRELMGLELLVERLDRAQRAETKLGEATAFLESCLIDEDKLTEIEDAFVAALEAHRIFGGMRRVVLPRVHLHRPLVAAVRGYLG